MSKLFAVFSLLVACVFSTVAPIYASEDTNAINTANATTTNKVAETEAKVNAKETIKAADDAAVKVSEDNTQEKRTVDADATATKDDASNKKSAESDDEEPDCE